MVGLCFWWEWVDSNHLSLKTTDLQSAPALQLRRTPDPLVRAEGIEPSLQAWKACILAFELCSQRFHKPVHYILFFYKRKHLFKDFNTVDIFAGYFFRFHRFKFFVCDSFWLWACINLYRRIIYFGFCIVYIVCTDSFCPVL